MHAWKGQDSSIHYDSSIRYSTVVRYGAVVQRTGGMHIPCLTPKVQVQIAWAPASVPNKATQHDLESETARSRLSGDAVPFVKQSASCSFDVIS